MIGALCFFAGIGGLYGCYHLSQQKPKNDKEAANLNRQKILSGVCSVICLLCGFILLGSTDSTTLKAIGIIVLIGGIFYLIRTVIARKTYSTKNEVRNRVIVSIVCIAIGLWMAGTFKVVNEKNAYERATEGMSYEERKEYDKQLKFNNELHEEVHGK